MLVVRTFVVFALVLALVGVGSAPSDASHAWSTYHWGRTANPFTLQLGDNVTGDWDGHLATASADWSVSSVLDTTIAAGGTTPRKCRATSGRVEVCNATYGRNGWLGLAQIWLTIGQHIAQGAAKMNDFYLGPTSTYTYNNDAEREHVMCQEVGHTFGLNHQSEDGSSLNTCMDYYHNTSDTDLLSTQPNQHDYDQLVKIYSHLDRFNSSGMASSPSGPGAPVFVDGHGPDGTPNGASPALGHWYIEPLGGGEFLVTHVYWK